jgi:hypothetical protein
MVVDGPRILFNEIGVPLSEVSSQGGDVVAVNTPFSAFFLLDISPDKTELLTAVPSVNSELDQPLWILSVASGLARRVGEIRCHAAAWSPDGQKIATPKFGLPLFRQSSLLRVCAPGGCWFPQCS